MELGPEFPVISIRIGHVVEVGGRMTTVEELEEFIRRMRIVLELLPFQPLGDRPAPDPAP